MRHILKRAQILLSKQKLLLVSLFIVVILTSLRGLFLLDPDFGWHLRLGQIMLQQRSIPYHDYFSYTMPSYHFVDYEWLSNIVIAIVFVLFGIVGNAVLFGFFVALALYTATKTNITSKNPILFLLSFIIAASILFLFSGIRPQILSWIFFSLVSHILYFDKNGQSKYWLLPPIFLIWANMHGAFPLGIGLLLIKTIYEFITKNLFRYQLIIISVLSTLLTLINPYTWHLWKEIINITVSSQKGAIAEWMPSITYVIFPLWLYVVLVIVLSFEYRKRITTIHLVISAILLMFLFSSIRNVPFFILFTLPLFQQCLAFFMQDAHKNSLSTQRLQKILPIFYFIVIIFCVTVFISFFQTLIQSRLNPKLVLQAAYPVKAVAYLQHHPFKGHVFSTYNWGGYLIWQLPGEKEFVDGRMPAWQNPSAPSTESRNAFRDYARMTNLSFFIMTLRKYHISVLLLPHNTTDTQCLLFSKWCRSIMQSQKKQNDVIFNYLGSHGWEIVYADSTEMIYENKAINRNF